MAAPTKLPWRTSNGAMLTCTCSIASSEIGATLVRSPGCRPRPNELLKIRTVNGDVVEPVILAGERRAARLRRQPRDRLEASGDRRQVRDIVAIDRGRGAGSRRREDRIAHARHFNLFGDRNGFDADVNVTGDAEVDVDVLDGLRRERRRRHRRCRPPESCTVRRRACAGIE